MSPLEAFLFNQAVLAGAETLRGISYPKVVDSCGDGGIAVGSCLIP